MDIEMANVLLQVLSITALVWTVINGIRIQKLRKK